MKNKLAIHLLLTSLAGTLHAQLTPPNLIRSSEGG